MSHMITLARPYARAAFELAHDAVALVSWSNALAFAAHVAKLSPLAGLRANPCVSTTQLVALHLPRDQPATSPFARFLETLACYHRLALLPEVAWLFEYYRRESRGYIRVKVTSAIALDIIQCQQIDRWLRHRFKRDIELEMRVDPDLLGGVLIDTGDEIIDGSVRGHLQRLTRVLTH